jgi:hypothetical protein
VVEIDLASHGLADAEPTGLAPYVHGAALALEFDTAGGTAL